MDTPNCPVCSKPMNVNPGGVAGDPAFLCPTDDAAHRAAAAARKAERLALLRAAKEAAAAPTVSAATLDEIAARERVTQADLDALDAKIKPLTK